ncbi:MAG: hypothetical protein DRR19_02310 [Candidatus Parabeggiatoa sp. nov. 1]|nr:MAG: hypothetical protein DRR19_02310 [Gammaproteobacteria bacterium]
MCSKTYFIKNRNYSALKGRFIKAQGSALGFLKFCQSGKLLYNLTMFILSFVSGEPGTKKLGSVIAHSFQANFVRKNWVLIEM